MSRRNPLRPPKRAMPTEHDLLARAVAKLGELGYAEELLARDYRIWSSDGATFAADLVAFARAEPRDMSTCAIVIEAKASPGSDRWSSAVRAAAAAAAPVVASVTPDGMSFTLVGPNLPATLIGFTAFTDETDASLVNRLSPAALMRTKL